MTKGVWCLLVAPMLLISASGTARADSQADVAAELAKARDLSARGDQRNACRAYQHASELAQGKSAASLIGLSVCHTQAKEGEKAIAAARQALAAAATPEERSDATMALGIDLLRQTDEKNRTEALSVFKEQMAAGDAKIQGGYISALLTLHRDEEAARVLQDLRDQGKSEDDIQQVLSRVSTYLISPDDLDSPKAKGLMEDVNERLHHLDPEKPLRVIGRVTRPEILHLVRPDTTKEARQHHGFSGMVILEAIIDTAGKVTNVRILKGQPFGLSEKAMDAVKQWTFKPATLDGRPVKVFYVLTVNFQTGPFHPSPWPSG